ncbi:MAG: ferritin [Planctomycetota bacterium]|nr:ferritin [Planctomycetota bacterium]MDA1138521.1 ferritin [Planctomycetota bacterium]
MLSERMLKELNDQIRIEWESAYSYLAAAAFCSNHNYKGGAHFFRLQHQEEMVHAMKVFDYVLARRNGIIRLQPLGSPYEKFDSLLSVFEYALENEMRNTDSIQQIMQYAHEEHDYMTVNVLNWFASEQAEEEDLMNFYVDRLKMVGDDGPGLLFIDTELLNRQAAPVEQNPGG